MAGKQVKINTPETYAEKVRAARREYFLHMARVRLERSTGAKRWEAKRALDRLLEEQGKTEV